MRARSASGAALLVMRTSTLPRRTTSVWFTSVWMASVAE
jgi:hypothetical protein